jgi:hypothetical protein
MIQKLVLKLGKAKLQIKLEIKEFLDKYNDIVLIIII